MHRLRSLIFLLLLVGSWWNINSFIPANNDNEEGLAIAKAEDGHEPGRAKLKAFIHIGPAYTGISHLQHHLHSSKERLSKNGFLFFGGNSPSPRYRAIEYVNLQKLKLGRLPDFNINQYPVRKFAQNALQWNMHAVYASEELSTAKEDAVKQLRVDFKDFDVKIVIVFRESVTRLLSLYHSHIHNDGLKVPVPSFQKFLDTSQHFNETLSVIKRFSSVFGRQNVVVLDYFGIQAAGSNVAHVFTCKLLGVTCSKVTVPSAMTDSGSEHHLNTSKWQRLQLFEILRFYAQEQYGCTVTHVLGPWSQSEAVEQLWLQAQRQDPALPLITLPNSHQIDALEALDNETYRSFSDNFLFADLKANHRSRGSISVVEIDYAKLIDTQQWQLWLEHSAKEFITQKVFQNCTFDSKVGATITINDDKPPTKKKKRLKAFLHIGPHKTGTTHMQSYLNSITEKLRMVDFLLYPSERADEYILAEEQVKRSHPIRRFVRQAKQDGKNIILSAEALSKLSNNSIHYLQKDFSHFDVTIVAVYRESMNRWLSSYSHLTRRGDSPPGTLSRFLERSYLHNDMERTLNLYGAAFGSDAVVVLDYYGVISAEKDIAFVFICELIGLFCTRSDMLNKGKALHENAASDWVAALMVEQVLNYTITTRRCKRKPLDANEMQAMTSYVIDGVAKANQSPPLKTVPMNNLIEKVIKQEKNFYNSYEKNFLYMNLSANSAARQQLHFDEIDTAALWRNKFWKKWLNERTNEYLKYEWITDCH